MYNALDYAQDLYQGRCSIDLRRRTVMAKTSMCAMNKIWKDRSITTRTKIGLVFTLMFPIAIYTCKTWSMNAANRRNIDDFDMWCWKKLLYIPWAAKMTNESILLDIGERTRLFNAIIKQKLQYFGQIARCEGDNLEKRIMFGILE